MRSGTRKVGDSKPDAASRKESDAIQMNDIGMGFEFFSSFSVELSRATFDVRDCQELFFKSLMRKIFPENPSD